MDAFFVPPLEAVPTSALFLATHRGRSRQASLEIVNHGGGAVSLLEAVPLAPRLEAELRSTARAERLELRVTLHGRGDAGRRVEKLELASTGDHRLAILVHTWVRERVYAFPDQIVLGELRRPPSGAASSLATATVMVHSVGAGDFRVRAWTDVDAIKLAARRGESEDRYELELSWSPADMPPGPFRGTIHLEPMTPSIPRYSCPSVASFWSDSADQ